MGTKIECAEKSWNPITGCETGAGARPCDLSWISDIVKRCEDEDVPLFVKKYRDEQGNIVSNEETKRFPLEYPDGLNLH